jgi:catechol 2,3-dioxygenase-like lactoylglutathione lyase family enzyme
MNTLNPIRILRLDHVVLRVADLERSIHFYTQVLDAREERRIDKAALVQLRAGAQLIDLVSLEGQIGRAGGRGPESEGRNVDHFALRIESFDEAQLRAHLDKHGVEPGEVHMRYGAEGLGPSMYIRDPDGNLVELKGPSTPAD